MSQNTKERGEDEKLSPNKVYEIIKSGFLHDLFWDVLSNLKDIPAYQNIRSKADEIINQNLEVLTSLSNSEADRDHRKHIVAKVCSMAYTVDTVCSKILYIKLEQVFKSEIDNILKELRKENKIPDDVWRKFKGLNNSQIEQSKVTNNPVNKKTEKSSLLHGKEINFGEKVAKDLENNKRVTRNTKKVKTESQKKNGNERQVTSMKNTPRTYTRTRKRNLEEGNLIRENENKISAEAEMNVLNIFNKNEDSDTESFISVGGNSLSSVSSVHTSDLSSYDDEISLCSEDEGSEKKKSTLADLVAQNKRISCELEEKFNISKFRKSPITSKENNNKEAVENSKTENSVEAAEKSSEFDSSQLSISNTSSKRVRKPNSKYSSVNILCHSVKVKERKKQSAIPTKNENEKMSSEFSPKKKRTVDEISDVEGKTPTKMQKTNSVNENINNVNENNTSDDKNLSKQNLHKQQSSLRSLTSRRTAPVTLYSTAI